MLFRLLLRILFSMLMIAVGNRVGGGQRRVFRGAEDGRIGRRPGGPKQGSGAEPLDRSDVVDVPFTEIPPPAEQPRPGGAPGV
jgi:hypothetical protein